MSPALVSHLVWYLTQTFHCAIEFYCNSCFRISFKQAGLSFVPSFYNDLIL